ncbi:hypothetical protein AB0O00_15710, partial [Kitasatospora sp. NPDC093558]
MEFQGRFGADGVGGRAGEVVAGVDEPAESVPAEGAQRDGDLEGVGAAGGAQRAAEQAGVAGVFVVDGVEVLGAAGEGDVGLGAADEEDAGPGGLCPRTSPRGTASTRSSGAGGTRAWSPSS